MQSCPINKAPKLPSITTGTCANVKDYHRLTVSQLKALCKERHISGYSKLYKATLVELVLQNDVKSSLDDANQSTAVATEIYSYSTLAEVCHDVSPAASVLGTNNASGSSTPGPASSDEPKNRSQVTVSKCLPTLLIQSAKAEEKKNFVSTPSHLLLPGAEEKITGENSLNEAIGKVLQIKTKKRRLDLNPNLSVQAPLMIGSIHSILVPKVNSFKRSNRFRAPLVSGSHAQTLATGLGQTECSKASEDMCNSQKEFSKKYYVDLTLSPAKRCEKLRSITFPPPLLQRKEAIAWSVILSRVSGKNRSNCALACRTMHYGVSLSAVVILRRDFWGRRFAEFRQKYSLSTTDFWPYLNIRQHEQQKAYKLYNASFLPHFYKCFCPISPRIWANPDHDKQVTVALRQLCLEFYNKEKSDVLEHRFLITRVWFALSTTADSDVAYWTVFDIQEVIEDEIWTVSINFSYNEEHRSRQVQQTFYILESTCEIIGRPCKLQDSSPETADIERSSFDNLPLRVDWSEYVRSRLLGSDFCSSPFPSLLEHLKWAHFEEYDQGISRHWLNKIRSEGDTGNMKRNVAERYTMACLAGNSISGRWMTCAEMAQEFSGQSTSSGQITIADSIMIKRHKPKVNLFLPAHHHVEGVYFTTASGKCLHPALAVVQTPGREYYILRDNGMEVGCEEDGVWPVWRELLKCDDKGLLKA